MPNLRFPEFDGEWEVKKLGEVSDISSGGTPSRANPLYWNGNIPWVSTTLIDFNYIDKSEEYITEVGLKNSSAKLFPIGTLLMAMYGQGKTRGKISILNIEATTNQACGAIITNKEILNPLFAFQNLAKRYDEIRDLSNQGGQENLSGGIIKGIEISFPSLPEQQKIATFLSLIDERIQTQSKIIGELKLLKSSIVKKFFENELKFKNKDSNFPNWEKKKLGEISKEHLQKNRNNQYPEVFSVAKHKGVINQIVHLGRSFSAKEITHYKLVYSGDLVYTKSPTSEFPFGIIKQNRTGRIGVVSPLYCVFTPKTFALGYLLHEYFASPVNTFNYLNPLVQKGAKNTMNINNDTFLNGAKLFLPMNEKEQDKIYNVLSLIGDKIEIEKRLLIQYENQKKYLLQNLFI